MQITAPQFKANAARAIDDKQLQRALNNVKSGFIEKRRKSIDALPEFEALRDAARDIKNHTLDHLDLYLETYEKNAVEAGGHVHWAETAADARAQILDICRKAGAKTVTKGKSMIAEEIGINDHLEANGIEPVETDLGEYIIQLRHEAPSHIIAPAVHVNADQVEADFRRVHTHLDEDRDLSEPETLLAEARGVLRDKFLAADVGITGANFLVAETGTSIIVTNEGNGDLTQILPRIHIVIASIEKVVPTLEDASTILRLLARSATGQDMSVYTTLSTGAKQPGDPDGPDEYHVIILDNGRTSMLGTEFLEMLRCIRCGACMNHCPVYHAVGGHAYGATYVGPMGAVLSPAIFGIDQTGHLPNASTFCGRCESVCPMRIPLPKMMRHWREKEFERGLSPATQRAGLKVWALFARRPKLYRLAARIGIGALSLAGVRSGRFRSLPLAGGWTKHRDLPVPAGKTFMDQWKAREKTMGEAVMSIGEWLAFAGIWFVATIPLGPNALNCILVTARYGIRSMAWPIIGLLLASVIFQTLVFLGIVTLLSTAAGLFTLVKLIGCAYLVWLGIKLWRGGTRPFADFDDLPPAPLALVRRACLISLSNPKAMLSYAALFTQFIDPQVPVLAQAAILTPTALAVLFIVYAGYALAGAPIRRLVNDMRRMTIMNRISGSFFIFSAAAIATSEMRR